MKTNLDFRLNKAEIEAFIKLLLNFASEKAASSTGDNVEFIIKPDTAPNVRYGRHLNAQEINEIANDDKSSAEIFSYKNGNFAGSFWLVLKFDNFFARMLNSGPLQQLIDETELTDFYNQFMYLIFGESYKSELLSCYEQIKSEKLKSANTKYKSLSKQSSSQRSKKKVPLKTRYNQIHDYLASFYDERIDYVRNLNTNFFDY